MTKQNLILKKSVFTKYNEGISDTFFTLNGTRVFLTKLLKRFFIAIKFIVNFSNIWNAYQCKSFVYIQIKVTEGINISYDNGMWKVLNVVIKRYQVNKKEKLIRCELFIVLI